MLNHPGEDLVLQPDFLLMVERVDVCLEFLQSHVWKLLFFVLLHLLTRSFSPNTVRWRYTFSVSSNALQGR